MVDPLLPVPGVSDELIRAINARFRQIKEGTAGQGRQGTPGPPGPPGAGGDLIIAPQNK